uniref:Serine/threonine/tyrosine interacting like 1 n=3 Tax=Canidae TaxID=9608 RepID=A0A8C0SL44_CANLF
MELTITRYLYGCYKNKVSRLRYYRKLHISINYLRPYSQSFSSLKLCRTRAGSLGTRGNEMGGSPTPLLGFLSALPSQYPGRPGAPQARGGTGRPCSLGWPGDQGCSRAQNPRGPGRGDLRLQGAPRRAYLGRGAEAAAESGAGRAGEGGEHGWLERAGSRRAGAGAGGWQVTPTTSTPHRAPGSALPGLARSGAPSGPAHLPDLAVWTPLGRGGGRREGASCARGARAPGVVERFAFGAAGGGDAVASGRESPHRRGGRGRDLGWKRLSGAISRMAGLVLCEPTELYNILNQVTKLSRLTEPNYLCLLDVRSKQEYDESHVITARRVKKKENEYLIPESVDLECVKYCVVYDNNTSTLEIILREQDEDDNSDDSRQELVPGAAVACGRALAQLTHHPVCILKGGYECFSAMYHFFRTQKIIWMPQELDAFQPYPAEIMPGKIYLGNFRQACDPKIQKDLKIKAHVNISMETGPFFINDDDNLLHIKIEDSLEANIFPFLRHLCHFLEIHLQLGSVILVFSTLGISRSCAAILAFLIHWNEQTLKKSWAFVKKCKNNMRPNRSLVAQLSEWEKVILGDFVTDILDPLY